jgi:hypothetical protein
VIGGVVSVALYRTFIEISLSLETITQVNLTPGTILIPCIPGTRVWAETNGIVTKSGINAK